MHQMETFCKPVSIISCDQTSSPRSVWVRIVSSRMGSVRRTSRKASSFAILDVLEDISSIQVIERRFVHNESAARVSLVIFGYVKNIPRWTAPMEKNIVRINCTRCIR